MKDVDIHTSYSYFLASQTHVSFSPEYEKAVESKQVAQQQAERAKYIVQRVLTLYYCAMTWRTHEL